MDGRRSLSFENGRFAFSAHRRQLEGRIEHSRCSKDSRYWGVYCTNLSLKSSRPKSLHMHSFYPVTPSARSQTRSMKATAAVDSTPFHSLLGTSTSASLSLQRSLLTRLRGFHFEWCAARTHDGGPSLAQLRAAARVPHSHSTIALDT